MLQLTNKQHYLNKKWRILRKKRVFLFKRLVKFLSKIWSSEQNMRRKVEMRVEWTVATPIG